MSPRQRPDWTITLGVNNSSTYYAVPKKGATAATVYNATAAQTSALSVPVKFGVKTNNDLPSGTYTNDVIYTMTPKAGCLTYTLKFDLDGGTGASGKSYADRSMSWGETIDLNGYNPTKSGYTFTGWSNGSSTFTDFSSAINPNSGNSNPVTLTAKYKANEPTIPAGACSGTYGSQRSVNLTENGAENFDYTGNVVCAYLQKEGYYKLEVWGAQGGNTSSKYGGYGGYAYGVIYSNTNSSLYVVVGKEGADDNLKTGAYNGGGPDCPSTATDSSCDGPGGGGATHIATVSGVLSSLSSSTNQAKVLIVAGGGGGGDDSSIAGSGGGVSGTANTYSFPGTQTQGYSFGQGQAGGCRKETSTSYSTISDSYFTNNSCGAGGGGWYGGSSGRTNSYNSGAGGSGYIGNSLLLSAKNVTKQMYTYNDSCTSSTNAATKTTCTSSTGHAVANAANTGNGYAKITYLGT